MTNDVYADLTDTELIANTREMADRWCCLSCAVAQLERLCVRLEAGPVVGLFEAMGLE